jgi:hypothetical protein
MHGIECAVVRVGSVNLPAVAGNFDPTLQSHTALAREQVSCFLRPSVLRFDPADGVTNQLSHAVQF